MIGAHESVHDYLKRRGCLPHIVKGGFEGLVEQWTDIVDEIDAEGYEGTLEDYLTDVDTRQLIAEILPKIANPKLTDQLSKADQVFKSSVQPLNKCLSGSESATKNGWSKEKNWWYFALPKKAGKELKTEVSAI